jgi:carbon monoxide dehydrogenase subunit G
VTISGSHALPAPRDRVYELFQDPAVLARAMPGCDRLDEVAPGEYEMRMKIAIAAVQGLFSGKVRLRDRRPPEAFRMLVDGAGRAGFVKGEGELTFTPAEGGTLVSYTGDVQVGGVIAAVGQRLLDTTAKFVIRKFFESMGQELAARTGQDSPEISRNSAADRGINS